MGRKKNQAVPDPGASGTSWAQVPSTDSIALVVLQQSGGGGAFEQLRGAVVVPVQLEARKGFEGQGNADGQIGGLARSLGDPKRQRRRPASQIAVNGVKLLLHGAVLRFKSFGDVHAPVLIDP